jgi:uncharacterized protein YqiB (DUF1249 family)
VRILPIQRMIALTLTLTTTLTVYHAVTIVVNSPFLPYFSDPGKRVDLVIACLSASVCGCRFFHRRVRGVHREGFSRRSLRARR